MGDYVSAKIEIGGRLPQSFLPEMMRWAGIGRGTEAGEELRNLLDEYIGVDGRFVLDEDEVCNGAFDDLELFCREHKLTYRRTNQGSRDIQASQVYWDPTVGKDPEGTLVSLDAELLVPVRVLQIIVDMLQNERMLRSTILDWVRTCPCLREITIPPLEIVV